MCGWDTEKFSRIMRFVRCLRENEHDFCGPHPAHQYVYQALGIQRYEYRSLWEADHIVPVIEGGGECGLEGIRTLCVFCHKSETAALRRRLAGKQKTKEVLEFV